MVPLTVPTGVTASPSVAVPRKMLYEVGLPLALAVQCSVAPVLPGVTVRLVGPLGTEAVAGVTMSWSTRETPWSVTANRVTELRPACSWACRDESWYTSKLPVIGKRSVVVITVPLTATPICRLLTLGNRPPWKAYRHSIVYRPLVGTTTLLNVMLPRVE